MTRPGLESIVTKMRFDAPAERAWQGLVYFEQVEEPPPWLLRRALPKPIGTEGPKSQVGDESLCRYETGHLRKRVTDIRVGRHYGFEVAEQRLEVGWGVRLSGGCYSLRELPDGSTEVALKTRYVSRTWPRWLWRRIEAAVGHRFHRHILGAIRRNVGLAAGEPRNDAAGSWPQGVFGASSGRRAGRPTRQGGAT